MDPKTRAEVISTLRKMNREDLVKHISKTMIKSDKKLDERDKKNLTALADGWKDTAQNLISKHIPGGDPANVLYRIGIMLSTIEMALRALNWPTSSALKKIADDLIHKSHKVND